MRKFDIPKYIYLRYISLYELDMRYVLGVNPQYQMNTFTGIPDVLFHMLLMSSWWGLESRNPHPGRVNHPVIQVNPLAVISLLVPLAVMLLLMVPEASES